MVRILVTAFLPACFAGSAFAETYQKRLARWQAEFRAKYPGEKMPNDGQHGAFDYPRLTLRSARNLIVADITKTGGKARSRVDQRDPSQRSGAHPKVRLLGRTQFELLPPGICSEQRSRHRLR